MFTFYSQLLMVLVSHTGMVSSDTAGRMGVAYTVESEGEEKRIILIITLLISNLTMHVLGAIIQISTCLRCHPEGPKITLKISSCSCPLQISASMKFVARRLV
jgi:hypothetical protein